MRWVEASTLLKAPEHIREILYNSGVYMVNDCFVPLYTEYHYRIHLHGGRGSGKSHHVSDWIIWVLTTFQYARIILVRYIHENIKKSIWKEFCDRVRERGLENEFIISYREMTAICKKTKNELSASGVKSAKSQTAKLKSLAGFTHAIMEEADEIPAYEKTKLMDSIRKVGVKIQIVEMFNTPRKTHHIWDDYSLTPVDGHDGYYTATPLPTSRIFAIWTNYQSNRHNLNEEYLSKYDNAVHGKDQNYYFTDVCGYIPSGNKGQIHTGWKRISLEDYNNLPYNKYDYLDWGETDPCAIGEVKMYKRQLYIKGLNYKPLKVLEAAKFLCKKGFTAKEMIICDSSQPDDIIQLRGYSRKQLTDEEINEFPQLLKGFSTVEAKKGPGSVEKGIRLLNEFDVYVVEDEESEHIWTEYCGYMWELDKDGKPTDQPVDGNDHHMNGIRYVVQTLRWA